MTAANDSYTVDKIVGLERWLKDRCGSGWEDECLFIGIADPNVAFEFKMRWIWIDAYEPDDVGDTRSKAAVLRFLDAEIDRRRRKSREDEIVWEFANQSGKTVAEIRCYPKFKSLIAQALKASGFKTIWVSLRAPRFR